MQYKTLASTALLASVASAIDMKSYDMSKTCDKSKPMAIVHNTCNKAVHVWSILKGEGCPGGEGVYLKPGETYNENYRTGAFDAAGNPIGTSIKISWEPSCDDKKVDITQLEYCVETTKPGYNYNFGDVSFVNCHKKENCPGRTKFDLIHGDDKFKKYRVPNNSVCPILSCDSKESCSKIAYVNDMDNWNSRSCEPEANMEYWICGKDGSSTPEVGSGSGSSQPAAASSVKAAPSSQAAAVSSKVIPTPAAYTPAFTPEAKKAEVTPVAVKPANGQKVHTEVVYVTQVIEDNSHYKRHAHKHQHFHA